MKNEAAIQRNYIAWLRAKHPTVLFCATVGGVAQTTRSRVNMVRQGYCKGIPDVIIYEARGGWHGLALELKAARGHVSEWQQLWLEKLLQRGYFAKATYSLKETQEVTEAYLALPVPSLLSLGPAPPVDGSHGVVLAATQTIEQTPPPACPPGETPPCSSSPAAPVGTPTAQPEAVPLAEGPSVQGHRPEDKNAREEDLNSFFH